MSKLGRIFGGGARQKRSQGPTTGDAIQKLRETEEMLVKKQDFLEKKIEQEKANARRNAKTNKQMALAALKRKKRLDRQLQQIDGTLTTIEQQRTALEDASTNTVVLTTMGEASKAMRRANMNMKVEDVEDMMDDIAQQQEVAKEISDAISNPVAFGQDFDEDELEAELNDLEAELEAEEQQDLDRELLRVGPSNLPEVPTTALPSAEARPTVHSKNKVPVGADDDDMAELAAWAS